MIDIFLKELHSLPDKNSDPEAYAAFEKRIKQGNLSREENPADHMCSFFLPVDIVAKKIFLVDHIKAGTWIPPGGHIDKGETPRQAVYREFQEELQVKLTDEPIELFAVKPVNIANPVRTCKIHNDFWFLVFIREQPFIADPKEFHDARWFDLEEGIAKVTRSAFIPIMHRIPDFIREHKRV